MSVAEAKPVWTPEDQAHFDTLLERYKEWALAHAVYIGNCRDCRHPGEWHFNSRTKTMTSCGIPHCRCRSYVIAPPHPNSRLAAEAGTYA